MKTSPRNYEVIAPKANPDLKRQFFARREVELRCEVFALRVGFVLFLVAALFVGIGDLKESRYIVIQNHLLFIVGMFLLIIADINCVGPYCWRCLR